MKKLILLLLFIPLFFSCSKESIKYTLTTSVSPAESGTINPNGGTVEEGQQVSVTASPAAEYLFDKWTGAASGNNKTVSVIMDSDKSVTANFIKKKYALTTSVEGEGTITEKIIKAGVATDYNSGTIIELTANPKAGWKFKEWTGDLTGTENPKEITVDKAKTVKAIFELLPPFYLDENGVTIKARDWVIAGTVGELNGVTYTAVNTYTLQQKAINGEDLSKVVTTLVTNLSSLAGLCNGKLSNYDITRWDVSNVTNMRSMLWGQADFNQDIGEWDVSKVINMDGMFYLNTIFNQDIGNWNVSNVTNMRRMFRYAANFNQDISSWNVGKVTTMQEIFSDSSSFNQDISNWDVSNVTNMQSMFSGAVVFNQDIGSWDVSKVIDMTYTFGGANNFNQDIGSWDVSKVTSMNTMFHRASSFNQDVGNWDVSNVITMQQMFQLSSSFNQDISNWDVSNVTNMANMFSGAVVFNQDIGSWDVRNVKYMGQMFDEADVFNKDIGNWDVSSVTNMYGMFSGADVFNQNLSTWCVNSIESEPDSFSTSSALTEANKPVWGTCPGSSYGIAVTASSNADYTLSGEDRSGDVSGNDPNLTFKVGDEVTFSVNAANHPFYLKTVAGTGTGNQISGITNNGTTSGSIVWTPAEAGTYYYQCSAHSGMVGTITVQ